jgi:predicted AAA+ superfamily ATPase
MVKRNSLVPRLLGPVLRTALSDTRVVFLGGPRQSGKSTFAGTLLPRVAYRSLDDAGTLAASDADPQSFVEGLPRRAVIDEIQRVPKLLLAIKAAVDRDKQRRILLTGSADVFVLPGVSESLAGRIEIHTLWPFAQSEIERNPGRFVDEIFATELPRFHMTETRTALIERIIRGGYPEALSRSGSRRTAWFESYVTSIVLREIRDISSIQSATDLPRILRLLAARTSSILNVSEVSRAAGIAHTTLTRYLALLEAAYLFWRLPAWSGNLGKRLLAHPKIVLTDCGVAAALQGIDASRLATDEHLAGPIFETFVAAEIVKLASWSKVRPSLFHFRSVAGDEVDLILERRDGSVVGIEVKAGANVDSRDFRGLRVLAAGLGKKFKRGIVLYTGAHVIGFGPDLFAMPIGALWLRQVEAPAR